MGGQKVFWSSIGILLISSCYVYSCDEKGLCLVRLLFKSIDLFHDVSKFIKLTKIENNELSVQSFSLQFSLI